MEDKKLVTDLSREELIEYVTVLESGIAEIMIEVGITLELNEELRTILEYYQSNEDIRQHRENGLEVVM